MNEEDLLNAYYELVEPLYEYVSRRCEGDRDLAEDITQEVWIRATKRWRECGAPEDPLPWLKAVAKNLLSNHRRRIKPFSLDNPPSGVVLPSSGEELGAAVATMGSSVFRALSKLRPGQAQILKAFHLEGSKVAEIASDLDLSERAVEGRLRRARLKLRKHLDSIRAERGKRT